ncbi:hypothetical protein PFMC_00514 [Plasmodium falciparum CAMP/Malaysia]|uniref:Uncharacterized protein n=1 Tax=Plasmodium falciparum (isolate Camp / Malaysia) TaxID=5835 RepID=A0A024XDR9_PLAFC|nr:hypothetical protein PFMC_00514 [Plasmodium falciparum CAMP/Malaysia]
MLGLKRKNVFYLLVSVPSLFAYFLKRHKDNENNYETLINNNDIEKIKKIRIHNKCSYIPLLFLNIYDSYIYKNKILRWLYFKFRKRRKDKEEYYYITNMVRKKRREAIKYNFISDEQNLFNKFYIYEIVLEYSLKYGILSPHLSLYILKNISEHCVNIYPSLYYYNKLDNKHNLINEKKLKYFKQINNEHNQQAPTNHTHHNNNNNNNKKPLDINIHSCKNTNISSYSTYNNMEKENINIYDKYNIHNFYTEKYISYKDENCQHITLNMIYLLNQTYDNICRICLNTNTNIYINFYMINILKYICYKNMEIILLNYNHIEDMKKKINQKNNTNTSLFKYIYSFFFFKKEENHIYDLFEDQMMNHLHKKENDKFYNYSNENTHNNIYKYISDNYFYDHINSSSNRCSFKNLKKQQTDDNTKHIIMGKEKYPMNKSDHEKKNNNTCGNINIEKDQKKDILKKIYFLKGNKLDDIQILNELYVMIYMRLLFECSLKLISIKKNIHLLEKKMEFDKDNKIIYLNSADYMNNLRRNILKRFSKNEERENINSFASFPFLLSKNIIYFEDEIGRSRDNTIYNNVYDKETNKTTTNNNNNDNNDNNDNICSNNNDHICSNNNDHICSNNNDHICSNNNNNNICSNNNNNICSNNNNNICSNNNNNICSNKMLDEFCQDNKFNDYNTRKKEKRKRIYELAKIYTNNIFDYLKGKKEKHQNEDNTINLYYIKKKFPWIFYLKNIIKNKDTSFIEHNNNIVNGDIKNNNIIFKKKYNLFESSIISYFYIKDIYEYNYKLRLYYIYDNLIKKFCRYFLKMNEHINRKLYKMKRAFHYYIYNFDQFIINNYYHIIHKKNIHKIHIHLKQCKDKEIDIVKFKDLYYCMINNINNIFSYIHKVDHNECVYRIFKAYNKILLYEYNYLNEKENIYYKNKIKKYLTYLNNNISNDLYPYNISYNKIYNQNKYKNRKNFSHIFYSLKNDIHLLLFLYTQRIQNCCDIFSYIYKKYNFNEKNPFLNYLYYELHYIVYSEKKKKKTFFSFISSSPYRYDTMVNSFTFSYFFFSLSYLLFILFYHPDMYASYIFFKTLTYSGLPTYYYSLYNNIMVVCGPKT